MKTRILIILTLMAADSVVFAQSKTQDSQGKDRYGKE